MHACWQMNLHIAPDLPDPRLRSCAIAVLERTRTQPQDSNHPKTQTPTTHHLSLSQNRIFLAEEIHTFFLVKCWWVNQKSTKNMLWSTKETGGHDGIAVLGRYWISPAQYTKQIKPKKREREREVTTSHVPKTRFPEYICFSDLIPLKRILCNSFNLQNNQHPKKQNPKKVSDTSEASGFSTKDL